MTYGFCGMIFSFQQLGGGGSVSKHTNGLSSSLSRFSLSVFPLSLRHEKESAWRNLKPLDLCKKI